MKYFPRLAHKTAHWISVRIAPALPAAVATRADYAGNSSAAASFNAAVRGSDTAAREILATPRPQDGTLLFGIAPSLSAVVATHANSAGTYSTAASFDAAVRGSKTAARDFFLRPVHKTAPWILVLRLPCLLL